MSQFLIQGIGFLGVLMFLISYHIRSNRGLYLTQALGSALFCLQFFLMGRYTGSLSLVVILIRDLLLAASRRYPRLLRREWIWFFSALCVAVLVITWAGPISLLPFAALLSSTVLYWSDNARLIRLVNLAVASPCWLVYDILIGSWGGIVNELITLASILLSVYRYGWKALGENRFGPEK